MNENIQTQKTESVDKNEGEYETLKAESMLAAGQVLREAGFPDEPEELLALDQEKLVELETELLAKINELTTDSDTGGTLNENRLTVKYLSAYLKLAEVASTSKTESNRLLENMEKVL